MKTYKRIDKICEVTIQALSDFDGKVVVADIATDHGYIAEKLSKYDKVCKVYATDISEKSLSKLEKLIKLKGLKKIETVVGNGLLPISQVDACVIAGIGGCEICKMIDKQNNFDNQKKCDIFILQPAQNAILLRKWIFDNRYKLILDIVIEDAKRFYPIIAIDISQSEENEDSIYNLWIGRDSHNCPVDYKNFLIAIKEYLKFTESISYERAVTDEVLLQKWTLYREIDKYLN